MKLRLGFFIGSIITGVVSEILFLKYAYIKFFGLSILIGLLGILIMFILDALIGEYKYYREEKEARLVRLIADEMKRREKKK